MRALATWGSPHLAHLRSTIRFWTQEGELRSFDPGGAVRRWDPATGVCAHAWQSRAPAHRVALAGPYAALCSWTELWLEDTRTGEVLFQQAAREPVAAVWPDGRLVWSDKDQKGVTTVAGGVTQRWAGGATHPSALVALPDGAVAAAVGKAVLLWRPGQPRPERLTGASDGLWWLRAAPDGRALMAGNKVDCCLWDLDHGSSWRCEGQPAAFDPDGQSVWVVRFQTVTRRRRADGAALETWELPFYADDLAAVNGSVYVAGLGRTRITAYSPQGDPVLGQPGPEGDVWQSAWSAGGRLALADFVGALSIWGEHRELGHGQAARLGNIRGLCWEGEDQIWVASTEGLQRWTLQDDRFEVGFRVNGLQPCAGVRVLTEGPARLAVLSMHTSAELVFLGADHAPLARAPQHPGALRVRDGLLWVCAPSEATAYDLQTFAVRQRVPLGHDGDLQQLSPDGQTHLRVERKARAWRASLVDTASGEPLAEVGADGERPGATVLSDGRAVLTRGLRWWLLGRDGAHEGVFPVEHAPEFRTLHAGPDGTFLECGLGGQVRWWAAPPPAAAIVRAPRQDALIAALPLDPGQEASRATDVLRPRGPVGPAEAAWRALCTAPLSADDLAAAERRLAGWPDTLRLIPPDTLAAAIGGQEPGALPLCRALSWDRPTAEGLQALARLSGAGGLRWMRLYNTAIGLEGAAALAAGPWRDLQDLALMNVDLKPDALAALLGAPWCPSLRTLNLSGNPLGVSGVLAVLREPRLSGLRALSLDRCRFPAARVAAKLPRATHLAGLRALDLSFTSVPLSAVIASPWMADLEHLLLGALPTPTELGALAGAGHLAGLRSFGFSEGTLTVPHVEALERAPFAAALQRWDRIIITAMPDARLRWGRSAVFQPSVRDTRL